MLFGVSMQNVSNAVYNSLYRVVPGTWYLVAYLPRYSVPELSLTRTGRPKTDFKKSDGDRLLFVAGTADVVVSSTGNGSSVGSMI
jgi:hypothetical protein